MNILPIYGIQKMNQHSAVFLVFFWALSESPPLVHSQRQQLPESDYLLRAYEAQTVKIGTFLFKFLITSTFYSVANVLLRGQFSTPWPIFSYTCIGLTLGRDKDWRFLEKALDFTVQEINSLQQGVYFRTSINRIDPEDLLQTSITGKLIHK